MEHEAYIAATLTKEVGEQVHVTHRETAKWKSPVEERVKANWDVTTNHNSRKMGIGVVVRSYSDGVNVGIMYGSPMSNETLL